MRRLLISYIFLALPLLLCAQYKIDFQLKGLENKQIMIGNHYGNAQYVKDTILLDSEGMGSFEGNEPLEAGIYLLIFPEKTYMEFLIDKDQQFRIEADTSDFFGTATFTGSELNTTFREYQNDMKEYSLKANQIRQTYSGQGKEQQMKEAMESLDAERRAITRRYTEEKMPGSMLAYLVKTMKTIEAPEIEIPQGVANPDSVRQLRTYLYHKEHYFDQIDFSDARILRTPVYHNKLETFFSRMVIQAPDSVNKEADKLLARCEAQEEFFRYTLVFLFNKYRESKVMGHDGILLHLADTYYLSGKADWSDSTFLADLRRDADLIRYNQIGNKAVNLNMETFTGDWKSLHDIPAEYVVIYFWEPNCGHCKTVTPELVKMYPELREQNIEIFGICTTEDKEEWANYISEQEIDWINGWDPSRQTHYDFYYNVRATPLIYILDRDKTIIAKRIGYEQILEFIQNHRRLNR